MGDSADDMYIMEEMIKDMLDERMALKIWTTKEGKAIRVTDMTDSHLQNTMNYLQRLKQTDDFSWHEEQWIEIMEEEFHRRSRKK